MIRQMFSHSRTADNAKARRLKGQREFREDKSDKLERTRHKGAHSDVEMANSLRPLGVDYLNTPRDQVIGLVRIRTEGKRWDDYPEKALNFLQENFDATFAKNEYGIKYIHYPETTNQKGETMPSFIGVLAEASGESRKSVKAVYQGLEKTIQDGLKSDRRVRLPGLGIVKITFRAAKEKRRGMNPFTKKEQWFKAKPASNKLRFTFAKALKEFVNDEVAVKDTKKKKKKSKK